MNKTETEIKKYIEAKLDKLFVEICKDFKLREGGITPDQDFLKDKFAEFLFDFIKQNE